MTNEQLDRLSNEIIGLAIKIHKQLGPGFVEKIYERAFAYELKKQGINFIQQKVIRVKYGELELGDQRVDFLTEDEIIVEMKSVSQIIELHSDQMISYLKTSGKRLGLILNFGRKKLEIKRLVNRF
ncbi:MAG TPA: GxxExxY protein [Elusimicrobia bacterium]|jgi:GxxExxY protein|nr:GxxExxY protein [Elusimicrobiota bacterium]